MPNNDSNKYLSEMIYDVLKITQRKKADKLRRVKIWDAKTKIYKNEEGEEIPYIVALTQYQDNNTLRWWPVKFRLDKPEGKMLACFIAQEEDAGRPVFDGETIYQVLYSEADNKTKIWKYIERIDSYEAA